MIRNFIIPVIVCIFFLNFVTTSFAVEKDSSIRAPQTTVQYDLSYPGLLPDHPFYVLKQVRDNMMTLLIGKPLDRSAFMLLQSDKQVSTAKLLVDQKKDVNMIKDSCISSQKLFEDAIDDAQSAKQEGFATGDLITQLRMASKKHYEIMREILVQLSPEEKKMFVDIEKRSLELIPRTASLKS